MAEERLQRALARAGHGSRRSSEELIAAGRVTVNGTVATLGDKVDTARDVVTVDGVLDRARRTRPGGRLGWACRRDHALGPYFAIASVHGYDTADASARVAVALARKADALR